MFKLTPTFIDEVLSIVEQAGGHLQKFYQQTVTISEKADHTPVTSADLFVSNFLIEKLTALSPTIPVLSEENCNIPFEQRQRWQRYWLIDPLDGTQQFIDKTDQFSILLALVENNVPVFGVVHSPVLRQTYIAMQNQGAYCLSEVPAQILIGHRHFARIPSQKMFDKRQVIKIAVGKSTDLQQLTARLNPQYIYEFVICGSSSVKALLVASGECDCYICIGTTGEWDTAATEILLNECGGGIVNLNFEPLSYNQRPSLLNPDFIMFGDKTWSWKTLFV